MLGVKSLDDVIASEGQQEVKEDFRPPLLGLGADPKKHGKVSVACVEVRLPDLLLLMLCTAACGVIPVCMQALSAALKVERRLAQHIRAKKSGELLEPSSQQKLPGEMTCYLCSK